MTAPVVELDRGVAVDALRERWRVALKLRPFAAAEFVDWFVELGYLERVDDERVRVTEAGERMAAVADQASSR